MAAPSDLIEALGAMPMYQLLPKQELAPLLSFSRLDPCLISATSYLSNASAALAEKAEQHLNSDDSDRAISLFTRMFEKFDDPALHNLKFKLPVILGQSNRAPESPVLGQFYGSIFESQTRVEDLDLLEVEPTLEDVAGVDDVVQLVDNWSDHTAVANHIRHYNSMLEKLQQKRLLKRSLVAEKSGPLKRARIEYHKLLDHREAELYVLIDLWDTELSLNSKLTESSSDSTSKAITSTITGVTNPSSTFFRKVSSLLSALAEANKFITLNVEYLQRIQGICSLFLASSIHENQGNVQVLDFLAHDLLMASESILIIMNAGIDDRRLHISSNINRVVDCIDILVKAALESPMSSGSTFVNSVGRLVDSVSLCISHINVEELTLTQLEYICIRAIFTETTAIGSEGVRHSMINLMVRMFKSYPGQRNFIVNEMLLNSKSLLLLTVSVQQLRLRTGVSVLFFTAFLLRLVQSFDALSISKDVKAFAGLPKSNVRTSATNLKRITIMKNIQAIYQDSVKVANLISEYFLKAITSSESSFRRVFIVFVDDIVKLMAFSDWPGAATMVESIMRVFTREFEANSFSGQSEPFVLEIVGKIGLEIYKQKQKTEPCCSFDATDKESIKMLARYQVRLLSESRNASKLGLQDQNFQYLLLKFLRQFEMLQEQADDKDGEYHIFDINSQSTNQSVLEEIRVINGHLDELLAMVGLNFRTSSNQIVDKADSSGKMYRNLILGESFEEMYESYFSILITSLNSSKAKVATKAIKLLSSLIEFDTRLLLMLKVNKCISQLLSGTSPLSRDAVIDLLGKYISESSELIQKYYKAICERAADNSILVRRRVMKLMKELYFQCEETDVRGYISIQFLKHSSDSDKIVREVARSNLVEAWFKSQISKTATCEVMAWLISSGPSAQEQLLQFFTLVDSDLEHRKMRQELKVITGQILEMIVEEIDGVKRSQATLKLSLLSTIVSWDKKLISFDDFLLLQPYLFSDHDSKNEICLIILRILKYILRDNRSINKEELIRLRDEIFKKLTRLEVLELHEAIPILQLIADLMKDNTSISNAILSTLRFMRRILSDNVAYQSDNQTYKCCKLLHLLGCVGAYCDLEAARAVIEMGEVGLLPNETVVSLAVKYLLHFTKSKYPEPVKIAAIKNTIGVCAHHPKIFMSESILKVLDEVFEGGSLVAKLTAVEELNEYLLKEDKALAKNVHTLTSSKTVKLDLGDFHGTVPQSMNEGISASVIQRYLQAVLQLCLMDSSVASIIPVQFLRLVVKLGFANPKVCISTIIALKASSNKLVKKIATELHLDLFDRHESLSDRNYAEAFKLATDYVKRSRKDEFWKEISFLRSVYSVVNRSYLAKKKFILSLSKLFTLDLSLSSLPGSISQRDMIVLLAINLLVVHYTSLEEVCHLLYHLDRSITMEGIDLAEKITSTVESKSGTGMSMENLQFMFIHGQTVLAMIYLRQQLAASYGIGPNIMDVFRPSKPDLELRQLPRSVLIIDYPISELEMGTSLAQPGPFGKVFTKLVLSMKNFTT